MPGRQPDLIRLQEGETAEALIAPELGGWLLRYARRVEGRGWQEALHWTGESLDAYPREIYAGNPVLFPLVGKNRAAGKDHRYSWQGRLFEMPQHGFARRKPWRVRDVGPASVTLELSEDEETLGAYPFPFRLRLTYRLEKGRLVWDQSIENYGPDPMPFSSGFHPYLSVPLTPDGNRTDGRVLLPPCRAVTPVGDWDGYRVTEAIPRSVSVSAPLEGTLFFTDLEGSELILTDPGRRLEVRLNLEGAPDHRFVALWTRSPRSPFFCVEPWTALPNSFSRGEDLILLEPGEVSRARLWLELNPG